MFEASKRDGSEPEKPWRFSKLPEGWVVVRAERRDMPAPPGWAWAHNNRDMFSPSFRYALVKSTVSTA